MCAKRVKRAAGEVVAKSPEQALNSLMALCARGEKSSGDGYRLMTRWGVEKSAQEEVLRQLIEDRFIDDTRYAGAYIREKTNINGWGVYKITQQLRLKGISREIIEEQIAELDRDSMQEKLRSLLERRVRTTKYTTKYQLRDKLLRYGASLGYDFSTVSDTVREVISEVKINEDEEDDLCLDF